MFSCFLAVCLRPVDIIFAVESRYSGSEFHRQIQFIRDIIGHFQISDDHTRVALISYGSEVHLKFGFNDFMDSQSLLQGLAKIKNDLNETAEVQFASVYKTTLIAFSESRSSSKALILMTFAEKVTQRNLTQALLSNTKAQKISVSVVAMGNKTNKLELVSLVEHQHNLFTGDTTDALNEDVPWIVDLICQGIVSFV